MLKKNDHRVQFLWMFARKARKISWEALKPTENEVWSLSLLSINARGGISCDQKYSTVWIGACIYGVYPQGERKKYKKRACL